MSYHVRRIALTSWPLLLPPSIGATAPREATAQDLLNMGLVEIGRDASYVYLDCCVLDEDRQAALPGEKVPLASGYVATRVSRLPAAVQQRVLRAKVYRAKTPGVNLRTECEVAALGALKAKVPATGKTSAKPANALDALAVLAEAKKRATAPLDQPELATAVELLVPMSDVQDGDVVEVDSLLPNRWSGEPDR